VAACGFDSSGGGMGSDDGEDATSAASTSADVSTAGSTESAGPTNDAEGSSGSDPTTSATTTDDTTGGVAEVGCPEALPADWVFCSDFEAENAADAFARWEPVPERMAIVDAVGREGSRALQFTYAPGDNWAGRAIVEFGDFPDDAVMHAPGQRFSELWVRMHMRTQADWPGLGAGDLFAVQVSTDVFEQPTSAVIVSLYTNESAATIGVHPSRCFTGPDPGCGSEDSLGAIFGTTPVWGTRRADLWQCVVVHLRLDDGGPNGVIELFVDDNPEASRQDYGFAQGWAGEGWNTLQISGSWPNGNPPPVQRWLDDVVISTAPVACG